MEGRRRNAISRCRFRNASALWSISTTVVSFSFLLVWFIDEKGLPALQLLRAMERWGGLGLIIQQCNCSSNSPSRLEPRGGGGRKKSLLHGLVLLLVVFLQFSIQLILLPVWIRAHVGLEVFIEVLLGSLLRPVSDPPSSSSSASSSTTASSSTSSPGSGPSVCVSRSPHGTGSGWFGSTGLSIAMPVGGGRGSASSPCHYIRETVVGRSVGGSHLPGCLGIGNIASCTLDLAESFAQSELGASSVSTGNNHFSGASTSYNTASSS